MLVNLELLSSLITQSKKKTMHGARNKDWRITLRNREGYVLR